MAGIHCTRSSQTQIAVYSNAALARLDEFVGPNVDLRDRFAPRPAEHYEAVEREQEKRDRESRESSKTKFEEAAERESEERAREAEDVRDLPPPREENGDD